MTHPRCCRSKTSVTILPQVAIQAMDIAFKHRSIMNPSLLVINKGRSGIYDSENQRKVSLGGGAEVGCPARHRSKVHKRVLRRLLPPSL